MQDGAGPHQAKKIKGFLEKSGIRILSWPTSLPDLNPIDNVWCMLQQRLGKRFRQRHSHPQTEEELMQAAQEEFEHIRQGVFDSWVDLIPQRIKEVLYAHGGHNYWLLYFTLIYFLKFYVFFWLCIYDPYPYCAIFKAGGCQDFPPGGCTAPGITIPSIASLIHVGVLNALLASFDFRFIVGFGYPEPSHRWRLIHFSLPRLVHQPVPWQQPRTSFRSCLLRQNLRRVM